MSALDFPLWLLIWLDAVRLTAALAGAVAFYDAVRSLRGLAAMGEAPPTLSAIKWAFGGAAAVLLGLGIFLSDRLPMLEHRTAAFHAMIAAGWTSFAIMMVLRARSRVANAKAIEIALGLTFIAALVASALDRGF